VDLSKLVTTTHESQENFSVSINCCTLPTNCTFHQNCQTSKHSFLKEIFVRL